MMTDVVKDATSAVRGYYNTIKRVIRGYLALIMLLFSGNVLVQIRCIFDEYARTLTCGGRAREPSAGGDLHMTSGFRCWTGSCTLTCGYAAWAQERAARGSGALQPATLTATCP